MFEQLCPEKAFAQVFPPGVGKPLPEDVRATAEETSAMSGTEMETSLRRKAYALISMAGEAKKSPEYAQWHAGVPAALNVVSGKSEKY